MIIPMKCEGFEIDMRYFMKKITNALCPLFSEKKRQNSTTNFYFSARKAKLLPSFFDETGKKIYFLGIGGVSMSALAALSLDMGFSVLGSDKRENEATRALQAKGVFVEIGETGEGLEGADLLVYTLAVSSTHPILKKAAALGIQGVSRPTFLGALASRYERCAAVCGMHGKSSTVAMAAHILSHTVGTTVLSGAALSKGEGCYRQGNGALLLMEACEYKAAFLAFFPTHAAVLNIEWEHTDYYKNERAVYSAFSRFVRKKSIQHLVLPKQIKGLRPRRSASVLSFGDGGDFYAVDKEEKEGRASFMLCFRGEALGRVSLRVLGAYQIENALAAAALSFSLGAPKEALAPLLSSYGGIPRRMEKIGLLHGAPLYLDYAHHPSELAAVLKAAKGMGSVTLVFQPHTYSRLLAFKEDFISLFKEADRCGLLPVYAAREKAIEGIESKALAKMAGITFLSDFSSAARFLAEGAKEGSVLLLVGAGDVDGVIPYINMEESE